MDAGEPAQIAVEAAASGNEHSSSGSNSTAGSMATQLEGDHILSECLNVVVQTVVEPVARWHSPTQCCLPASRTHHTVRDYARRDTWL